MSLVSGKVLAYLLRRRLSRKPMAASKGAKRLSRVLRAATGPASCTAMVQCQVSVLQPASCLATISSQWTSCAQHMSEICSCNVAFTCTACSVCCGASGDAFTGDRSALLAGPPSGEAPCSSEGYPSQQCRHTESNTHLQLSIRAQAGPRAQLQPRSGGHHL